ncbi:MAG: hypothetical protein QM722_01005 [Piscinibacter sp.]
MPSTRNTLVLGDVELARRRNRADRSGIVDLDLEADHRAAAAPLERRLEQEHQILGLFLDFDIAVADDAERALRRARYSRETAGRRTARSPARA